MSGTQTKGNDEMLQTVAGVLAHHGAEGWLVGGSVRDRELRRYSPDLDVVVTGEAGAIARDVARALGLPWFALSERHGAYRVVGAEAHVDVAAMRGGDILADLAERDFTINAMAMPVRGAGALGEFVDPFNGLTDLRAGRVSPVSDHIFRDDPLRLMRAARFAHVLGLRLEPTLREAVREQAAELRHAAPERVATEMILTLDSGKAGDAVRLWQELDLLDVVVPELRQQEEWGALFASLDRLEGILADPAAAFPGAAAQLERRLREPVDGATGRSTALRLAALLRGVGPVLASKLGRRLKLSSPMMALVESAARMSRWGELSPMAASGSGPGRNAVLFLWAAAPWEPEVILLAAATRLGTRSGAGRVLGGGLGAMGADAERLMSLWGQRATGGVPPLPLDGYDLMRELGLEPGPRLGLALRAARLAWEAGEATIPEQILAAARAAL